MTFIEVFLIELVLALDAFALSLCIATKPNISKKGTINCQNWNKSIMKPVIIKNNNEEKYLESISECARYLSTLYNVSFDHIRTKLKAKRSHIYDYDIIYLNAETKRNGSKEQEIVHKSDLVGTTDR